MKHANTKASYQVQLVQRRYTNETEGFTSFISQKKTCTSFSKKYHFVLREICTARLLKGYGCEIFRGLRCYCKTIRVL